MLGFSFSCLTAWGSELVWTVVCGQRGCKGKEGKGKEGKGRERKGKEGKGWERKEKGRERKGKEGKERERKGKEWEKKPLEISEFGCADGWKWLVRRSRWWWASLAARTAADGKWVRRIIARTAADGVGAREWLEMGGEKKQPLVMSELGCADGCGREKGAENCADGCGWRGCNGVAGNYGCGEEATGDERAWLRGRLRTANGWEELRGRLRTAWVPGSGWKLVGRRSRWRSASLAARTAADGKWVRRIARTAADGVGARGKWARRRSRWRSASVAARTAADGVGATEWLEMGAEKKPLEISELGCADGCGREMGAENCADGCGRRGCNGVAGNGWREDAAGDERAWLRGGCGRQMGAENYCADGCGRRGCKGVSGWKCVGRRSDGDERAWLRGRLRTGKGCGELRGQPRTAWVQGSGWKWFGRRSRWGWASLAARTAADGVGAREWLEMCREKKPLEMSELGCTDGCGRELGAENCADGCGRRGCKGVAGNGWGEEQDAAHEPECSHVC